MGTTAVLTSENKGHWMDENPLAVGNADNLKFEVFNTTIKKFNSERAVAAAEPEKVQYGKTGLIPKSEEPNLVFPDLKQVYDISKSKSYSQKVQSWQGVIIDLDDNGFTARLQDLTNGGTDEIGEFGIDDITPDDIKFVKRGGVFYWSVGLFMINGQREKKSTIRFQRLILLDEEDIDLAVDAAKTKFKNLKFRTIDDDPSQRVRG